MAGDVVSGGHYGLFDIALFGERGRFSDDRDCSHALFLGLFGFGCDLIDGASDSGSSERAPGGWGVQGPVLSARADRFIGDLWSFGGGEYELSGVQGVLDDDDCRGGDHGDWGRGGGYSFDKV